MLHNHRLAILTLFSTRSIYATLEVRETKRTCRTWLIARLHFQASISTVQLMLLAHGQVLRL